MVSIKLERRGVTTGVDPYQSYILNIKAVEPVEMPAEIFLLQKNRVIVDGEMIDDPANDPFFCVADPADLEEYPLTRPDEDSDQQFYRTDEITVLFRSVELMEETWGFIKSDVRALVRALNSYATLELQEEVIING